MQQRRWMPTSPVSVRTVLSVHQRGGRDPAFRLAPDGSMWRAVHTPDGPGTLAVAQSGAGEVWVRAWGAGAGWLIDSAPALVGADDDREALVPRDDVVARLVRRSPGLAIGRSGRVWEALVASVMEQKVVGSEAYRAWRYLLTRYGDRAPGPVPADMRVPPPRSRWREITEADWHRSGLEPVRARTIRAAAAVDVESKCDRLTALRGIGPWTAAHTRIRALGDPDAVPVGDYHTPSVVGTALIGERVDDERMLELLEPYAGQRYRVIRLCEVGAGMPERRGPRMSIRDYRSF
ncbi:DNA-3-methyladenine glycosylase family protein [Gordonia neofelifaecis]|uniref:3-methyladenine DNA glycosylase/8-oxoguanine DNA glycosylase-like protein n=1 Tax=Gordonia neofelifaecis NRRL B-59395 TaxID=644548 RepID=F1YIT2_9ACTN|nr:3-methyladenine DNA glycosylase [Gordonia neofelifaecis]EGD55470.1 3-methyladenine DNA glycosylase/8-oxoguanine DNA glycosylase-like protein [Gordonia neofelifaecis NRRL B-59395]